MQGAGCRKRCNHKNRFNLFNDEEDVNNMEYRTESRNIILILINGAECWTLTK